MDYITSAEYNQYTGRPASEADSETIGFASALLDARVGNYPMQDRFDKLDEDKQEIVKRWVAKMCAVLIDRADANSSTSEQEAESISLGNFSVTYKDESDAMQLMPESMQYADLLLTNSGLINRAVTVI